MKKEFVNYNQALKLKALGFDEPCLASWSYTYELQNYVELNLGYIIDGSKNYTNAPTFSQAFRWFREKYNLLHEISFYRDDKRIKKAYWYFVYEWNKDFTKRKIINDSIYFKTYEEAELACIDKLIELTFKSE